MQITGWFARRALTTGIIALLACDAFAQDAELVFDLINRSADEILLDEVKATFEERLGREIQIDLEVATAPYMMVDDDGKTAPAAASLVRATNSGFELADTPFLRRSEAPLSKPEIDPNRSFCGIFLGEDIFFRSGDALDPSYVRFAFAHELFHCISYEILEQKDQVELPKWIGEGLPTAAAYLYILESDPGFPLRISAYWQNWFKTDVPLQHRDAEQREFRKYTGAGLFLHMRQFLSDDEIWKEFIPILRASESEGTDGALKSILALFPDSKFATTLAPALLRNPDWGPEWISRTPPFPEDVARFPTLNLRIGEGSTLVERAIEYKFEPYFQSVQLIDLPPGFILNISAQQLWGRLRIEQAGDGLVGHQDEINGSFNRLFCVRGTCPCLSYYLQEVIEIDATDALFAVSSFSKEGSVTITEVPGPSCAEGTPALDPPMWELVGDSVPDGLKPAFKPISPYPR